MESKRPQNISGHKTHKYCRRRVRALMHRLSFIIYKIETIDCDQGGVNNVYVDECLHTLRLQSDRLRRVYEKSIAVQKLRKKYEKTKAS